MARSAAERESKPMAASPWPRAPAVHPTAAPGARGPQAAPCLDSASHYSWLSRARMTQPTWHRSRRKAGPPRARAGPRNACVFLRLAWPLDAREAAPHREPAV
jgi:hypothetical protein